MQGRQKPITSAQRYGDVQLCVQFVDLSADTSVENRTPMCQVSQTQLEYGTQGPISGVSELVLPAAERNVNVTVQDENHRYMKASYLRSKFCPIQSALVLLDHGAKVNAGKKEGNNSFDQESEGEYHD